MILTRDNYGNLSPEDRFDPPTLEEEQEEREEQEYEWFFDWYPEEAMMNQWDM